MLNFLRVSMLLCICISVYSSSCFASPHLALWITRWDYGQPADIAKIMNNAKELGATDVLFQVRGNATVFYPSSIEPWAGELTGDAQHDVGKNPGWDPLSVAIQEAKKAGLAIHAWMNVFPGWRGQFTPPKESNQVWVTNRSWFIIDHKGVMLRPQKSGYAFLSPGNPDVRTHLASVFGEVAETYPDLDGIHMDYVRYPTRKEYGSFRDFSYDKASVNAYKLHYKKAWPHYDQEEWAEFKCENVTETIRQIRKAMKKASPGMELSSTFLAEIHTATEEVGQNPMQWLEEELVDWVVPMVYRRSTAEFQNLLNLTHEFLMDKWADKVVLGLNIDFNSIAEIQSQMTIANNEENGGQALFAYSTVFPDHSSSRKMAIIQNLWQERMVKYLLRNKLNVSKSNP